MKRNPSCIVNQAFDVSFDYILNVDSIQSPVSGINRDNTKKVNEIFEFFRPRCQISVDFSPKISGLSQKFSNLERGNKL